MKKLNQNNENETDNQLFATEQEVQNETADYTKNNEENDEENDEAFLEFLKMQHKNNVNRTIDHLQSLTRVLMATNKVSQLQKVQANKAIADAIELAFNLGINENINFKTKSLPFFGESNNIATMLVHTMDSKLMIASHKIKQQQQLHLKNISNQKPTVLGEELEEITPLIDSTNN